MKKLVSSMLLVSLLAGTVSAGASFAMDPDLKKPRQNMAMKKSKVSGRRGRKINKVSGHRGKEINKVYKEISTSTYDKFKIFKEFKNDIERKGDLSAGFTFEDLKKRMPGMHLRAIKTTLEGLNPKDAIKSLRDRAQELMKDFIIAKPGVRIESDEILTISITIAFIEDYLKKDVVSQNDVDNLATFLASAEVGIVQGLMQLELDKR